jgi:hypothetical protein
MPLYLVKTQQTVTRYKVVEAVDADSASDHAKNPLAKSPHWRSPAKTRKIKAVPGPEELLCDPRPLTAEEAILSGLVDSVDASQSEDEEEDR